MRIYELKKEPKCEKEASNKPTDYSKLLSVWRFRARFVHYLSVQPETLLFLVYSHLRLNN